MAAGFQRSQRGASPWRSHPLDRHHGPAVALERAEIVLQARGRFDLRATVIANACHELPPFRWRDGPRPVLERAEELPGGSVLLLAIRPAPGGVVLRVTGQDASEIEVLAPLAARVRRALALHLGLGPFHRLCRRDPLLRNVASRGLGRLLRGTSLFEDLVMAIACTGTPWARTARVTTGIAAFGRPCPAAPGLRTFPGPRALARADV